MAPDFATDGATSVERLLSSLVPFVLVRDYGYGDVLRVAVCDILTVHPEWPIEANPGLERYAVHFGALAAPDVKVMVIGAPTLVVTSRDGVLYHAAAAADPETGATLLAGHRLSTILMTDDLARECRSFAANPSAWFGYGP